MSFTGTRNLLLLSFACVFAVLLGHAQESPSSPLTVDWGPLRRVGTDVEGNAWTQTLGPIWETRSAPTGKVFRALRPFVAWSMDPVRESRQWEWLFPLAGGFTLKNAYYNRVLLAWRKIEDVTRADSPRRFFIMPFWFQGISRDGKAYKAFFPFGGTIRDFLARDEVRFFLFPLHAFSSINGVKTETWVWPLVSRSEGQGIRRFRIFPFFGRTQFKDHFVKSFVLWPFWTRVTYTYPGSEGGGFILWPLFGRISLQDQKTTYVLPPLIRFSEGNGNQRNHVFWPLYQHSTGAVEKTYFFPLWGTKKMGNLTKTFALWPLFSHLRTEAFDETRDYRHFVPFWHQADITPTAAGTRTVVSRELWPLFSYRRENERSRFRMLELWPGREYPGVERNLSPLVSLFTRERNGAAVDTEVLWGLIRHSRRGEEFHHFSLFPLVERQFDARSGPPTRRFSLLKGLFETTKTGETRSFRFLYFLKI